MLRRERILRWAVTAAIGPASFILAQAETAPPTQAPPAPAVVLEPTTTELDRHLARLSNPAGNTPEALEDAARRLTDLGTPEAFAALRAILTDPGKNGSRVAVAMALADVPPRPEFVDPLFVLLDAATPQPLLDATAAALRTYKLDPTVTTRLLAATAADRPAVVRVAAISALSGHFEKRVAQRLIELLDDPADAIQVAAVNALRDLAGPDRLTVKSWKTWWASVADTPDAVLREQLLVARANRFERLSRQQDLIVGELRRQLQTQLSAVSREQRTPMLLQWLDSPRASVRAFAAEQIATAAQTLDVAAPLRERLPALLTDRSADVRLFAARALRDLNDPSAFTSLLAAADRETDPRVREALANALGRAADRRATTVLLRYLDEASPPVQRAAADALARIADANAAEVAALADELRVRYEPAVESNDFARRRLLLPAMVNLRSAGFVPLFVSILEENEVAPDDLRRLAIEGLAGAGSREHLPILLKLAADAQPSIRSACARGIGKLDRDGEHLDALLTLADPNREPDPAVRAAAWETVLAVADRLSPERVDGLFNALNSDQQRQLELCNTLAARLQPDSPAASRLDVFTRQGRVLAALGRHAESADTFDRAFAAALDAEAHADAVELAGRVVRERLAAGNIAAAISFVARLHESNAATQAESAGRALVDAAQELAAGNDNAGALALIEQILAADATLPVDVVDELRNVRRSLTRAPMKRTAPRTPPAAG